MQVQAQLRTCAGPSTAPGVCRSKHSSGRVQVQAQLWACAGPSTALGVCRSKHSSGRVQVQAQLWVCAGCTLHVHVWRLQAPLDGQWTEHASILTCSYHSTAVQHTAVQQHDMTIPQQYMTYKTYTRYHSTAVHDV